MSIGLTNIIKVASLILSGDQVNEVGLTNIIKVGSLILSDDQIDEIGLTNMINATVILYPANTASQWILKTGFWNDSGVWDDNAKWKD